MANLKVVQKHSAEFTQAHDNLGEIEVISVGLSTLANLVRNAEYSVTDTEGFSEGIGCLLESLSNKLLEKVIDTYTVLPKLGQ